MADITVDITISLVSYSTWLRSSYFSTSLVGADGSPLIDTNEFGPDQEDAFQNFMQEASRELLKVFLSRQGDVTGDAFEQDGTSIKYRVNEATPVLPQSSAIKASLNEDVKNALFVYVSYLWLKMKKQDDYALYMLERYHKLTKDINVHLYKLHD